MTREPEQARQWTASIWPLVAGLAVGFLIGKEVGGASRSTERAGAEAPKAADAPPAGVKLPAKIYQGQAEFPAGWLKETDLASVAGISFAGLTDAQKTTALQALNERNCECGCGMGTIATCVKKDPNCPRSPGLAKLAIDMSKQGKGMGEILAAIDEKQKPAPGAAAPSPPPPAGARKVALTADMPRKGPKAAKVTIAEFSDFQCPFCKRVGPTVKEVEQKYGKEVAIVFINQPLPFHEHALDAAHAFQAANRQGKAWQMHDKMFENNTALERANLEKYAAEIGLNVDRFKKDMDDPKIKEEVAAHQKLANAVGANGTPTFYINGRELVGAASFAEFQKIIDEEIKKADALVSQGTPLKDVYQKLMEQAAAAPPAAPPAAAAAAEPAAKVDIKIGDAPVKGPASAPVTLIEFSDFQCPFCSRVNPTLKQIEDEYRGKIKIAFRNFPLPFHDKAHLAAEAALAANEQGKFWQMHDKLFANQQALDRPNLEKYADEIGLNMPKFKAALDSGKFKEKVDQDQKEGSSFGATGTPTFFVNGTRLVGAQPVETFKAAIDAELKKK
jgi:protein-disulfide isomerase